MCDRCSGVDVKWAPEHCPSCGKRVTATGEAVWCLHCGWGKARYPLDEMLREREYDEIREKIKVRNVRVFPRR